MTRSRGDVNKTAALQSPLSAAGNNGAHRFVWHETGHRLLDAMLGAINGAWLIGCLPAWTQKSRRSSCSNGDGARTTS